ncbi:MAG: transposase family protein [Desulfobulbaceae bacterium]|nr:transposase family protein [Desulfobulbaceae bacterium]
MKQAKKSEYSSLRSQRAKAARRASKNQRDRHGRRQITGRQKGIEVSGLVAQTIQHFYPDLHEKLSQISDPRDEKGRKYTIAELLFTGVAMFIFKQGTRNKANQKRDKIFLGNFLKLFGYNLAHMDTVDVVLRKIKEEELQALKEILVCVLMEKKVLRPGRLFGKYYLSAIPKQLGHCAFILQRQ